MENIIILSVCAFCTSVISAIAGMGGGITLITIMQFLLPFDIIIPIHGVIQLVSNSSRSFIMRKHIHHKKFLFFLLGAPFGYLLTTLIYKEMINTALPKLLIAVLILYVVFKPKKLPELRIRDSFYSFAGACCGFLSVLVGATGPFLGVFFTRSDIKKETIISTKSMMQTAIHFGKIPFFLAMSFNYNEHIPMIVSMSIAAIIGTKVGTLVLGKVPEKTFRLIFKTLLFLASVRILIKYIGILS